MENAAVRIQDGVLITNEDYKKKVENQKARSSFEELWNNPHWEVERKVKIWINKQLSNKTLSNDWVTFISPEHPKPDQMFGNTKTHKINNPARVITSGCSTSVESLSTFVEKELYELAENLPFEALRLGLECPNSIFKNKFCFQTDGTALGPHMSCSYSDFGMVVHEKAMDYPFKPLIWKRFRDNVIALWIYSDKDAHHYLDYLNTIDVSGKIRFSTETENKNGLEFVDLRHKLKSCNKTMGDVIKVKVYL